MKVIIYPSQIEGKLTAPSSKSIAQRAIAISLLTKGTSKIKNITWSSDTIAALSVAQNLGATVEITENSLNINGGNSLDSEILECGESGLCMRMFAPIAALYNQQLTLNASGSLLNRPFDMIEDALIYRVN